MLQVLHIAIFFATISSNTLVMKIYLKLVALCHEDVYCTVLKGNYQKDTALALYLYIYFAK